MRSDIVIDVGCATYGGDMSIPPLIEEFKPDLLIGLDASSTLDAEPAVEWVDTTTVVRLRLAAWTRGGEVGFAEAGLGGKVNENAAPLVRCVDLAALILATPRGSEVILKLDCEWAEYTLIPHLREHDADLRLKLALVEWHCEDCGIGGNGRHREFCEGDHAAWEERRRTTEALLRCETGEWNR